MLAVMGGFGLVGIWLFCECLLNFKLEFNFEIMKLTIIGLYTEIKTYIFVSVIK